MNNYAAAILWGGLAAGALDIVYAFVVYGPLSYGLTLTEVLQSVAAGWLGREASHAGGLATALIGLVTHFTIATAMAAVFVAASARLTFLAARPLLWGLLYGIVLYVAMNYVVVPLSAAGAEGQFPTNFADISERLRASFSKLKTNQAYPWMIWGTLFTHTVLVGAPIALIARRFLRS
ncbi:MAG TPA: hypothetical protein DHW63_11115 [Hyphomonadaceae bacterium]|nr:hypothetical protein [Hyphomonadaceae bacterium]